VCYAEREPTTGAWLFGVFYDDGDFEELDLQGLAARGPPQPYKVYVGNAHPAPGEKRGYTVVDHLPHPTLASAAAAVDAPALARAALEALAEAPPRVPDGLRELAGKVARPGGGCNPQRIAQLTVDDIGGRYMAKAGLLPPRPAQEDVWAPTD